MLTSLLSKHRRLLEGIAAARRTQKHARDRDDLYLEMAATGRIDRALDELLRERETARG